jgi:hypothetical protein
MYSRSERDLYSHTQLARHHARDCAEMARSTMDPHLQRSFRELEKQWLERAEKPEKRPLWRRIVAIVSAVGP